jgi:FkbM family methyltransferase
MVTSSSTALDGTEMFGRRSREDVVPSDGWDAVLAVLFPDGLDASQVAGIRAAIAGATPSPSAARRALGSVDQQTIPSPVTIRWSAADINAVDVGGILLTLDRADASISTAIAEGAYEPHVAATLDRLLTPGDVFVDIGANIGYHSVRAATAVGPTGQVVAVEANPENARLIAHTIEVNAMTNVQLLPIAVADSWGFVNFGSHIGSNAGFLPGDRLMSGRGTVVPTVPLDDLGLDQVSVVKIDVEGAEGWVIDGSLSMIEQQRPAFVMEFSVEMTTRVSERSPEAHLQRFVDWEYSISVIDRASGRPRRTESVDQLLGTWGDLGRMEDLLLQPEERQHR